MATTPAMRLLKQKGIAFEIREYIVKVKGAEYAAEALGWPLEAMAKTLIVALSDGAFVACVLPGDRELSLKALARAAGVKQAEMTQPAQAEKLTGYRVGGISPLGTRKAMAVWLDESLMKHETIAVNAGRLGAICILAPGDLLRAADARVAALAG